MNVIWMPFAKNELRKTLKYVYKNFGRKAKSDLLLDVKEANNIIGINPKMCKIEPSLADYDKVYRCYVVNNINKIIYRMADDHVEVVDFWDCRRNPNTLIAQIK